MPNREDGGGSYNSGYGTGGNKSGGTSNPGSSGSYFSDLAKDYAGSRGGNSGGNSARDDRAGGYNGGYGTGGNTYTGGSTGNDVTGNFALGGNDSNNPGNGGFVGGGAGGGGGGGWGASQPQWERTIEGLLDAHPNTELTGGKMPGGYGQTGFSNMSSNPKQFYDRLPQSGAPDLPPPIPENNLLSALSYDGMGAGLSAPFSHANMMPGREQSYPGGLGSVPFGNSRARADKMGRLSKNDAVTGGAWESPLLGGEDIITGGPETPTDGIDATPASFPAQQSPSMWDTGKGLIEQGVNYGAGLLGDINATMDKIPGTPQMKAALIGLLGGMHGVPFDSQLDTGVGERNYTNTHDSENEKNKKKKQGEKAPPKKPASILPHSSPYPKSWGAPVYWPHYTPLDYAPTPRGRMML